MSRQFKLKQLNNYSDVGLVQIISFNMWYSFEFLISKQIIDQQKKGTNEDQSRTEWCRNKQKTVEQSNVTKIGSLKELKKNG